MYDHRFTPTYLDCLQRYRHRPEVQAALHQQGHRLIWRQVGNVIILLLFGGHDPVYRRAERLRLEIDDSQNVLRVVDEDPATEQPVVYGQRRRTEGTLFMAWNDRTLAEFGFEQQEIPVLRRLDSEDELVALEATMRPDACLADRGAYLAAERSGRGTPLPRELREQVWDLYERYQTGLAERHLVDFNDILTRAYEVARDLDEPAFDAVIIDEAQDLTENAVRLLAALVEGPGQADPG